MKGAILKVLADNPNGLTTTEMRKRVQVIVGGTVKKKDINPSLYALLNEGVVEKGIGATMAPVWKKA